MEIFQDLDIGDIWKFGYRKYLEIWILEIFGDLDIGDIWRFGYWRLDFGDRILEIWIFEIGYWRYGDIWRLDIGDLKHF